MGASEWWWWGGWWSFTHHLDAVRHSVRVCVCEDRVSHWSPDGNCLGWTTASKQKRKEKKRCWWGGRGESSLHLTLFPLSLSFTHMHTHIRNRASTMRIDACDEQYRLMRDNAAPPPPLPPPIRKQTVCPSLKPKRNTLGRRGGRGVPSFPPSLPPSRQTLRFHSWPFNYIHTGGIWPLRFCLEMCDSAARRCRSRLSF